MEIRDNTHNALMDMRIKDIYEKLGSKDHEPTVQFILCLVKHVFEKSNDNGLRIGDGLIRASSGELDETTDCYNSDEEHGIDHLFFMDDSDNEQYNDDTLSLIQDNGNYASDES